MPRPRTAMRKIREVLRLHLGEGLSPRQVAASLSLPRITVRRYLERAHLAGVVWPLPEGMDDEQLERCLFAPPPPPSATRPLPDWPVVHQELRRKDVTLQLLWLEYKEGAPDGYQYSQFCRRYREWQRHLDVVMRQEHRAGEKLFVDWAGHTVPIVNSITGVITPAQLFVGVLGASNYLYAEAFPSQELAHWIAGHVHAFEAFGSVPRIVVCDNLRVGVSKAHRYEPMLNPTYQEMAAWYGVAVIPARAYKPRDKAKIEVGVLIAERWILARLRHRTFFSLAELNAAIRGLVSWLNERPFKKLDGCRRSLFEELERPVMRPLPTQRYEYADWSLAKVNIDYHIEVDRHYYSVPYQLTGQQVEVRLTASVIEVFLRHRRVASHLRSFRRGYHTTDPAHMPASHRRHLEWTPSRIENWAEKTGPSTAELVRGVMESRPHPEQGYRACLGILRLGKRFGDERLEAASRRAVAIRAFSFHSVESILKTGLDRQPLPTSAPSTPARRHQNLRGASYYR
jgi:transposase